MAAVRVPDVLVRISPKLLDKYQSIAVAGAGRGRDTPLPFTHTRADASTCATAIDRDSIVRLAAANKLHIEWVDLDGDGIRETPGLSLEGSRINSCLRSEEIDNATWAKVGGPPTVSANATTAPDGTTTADKVIPAASLQNPNVTQVITITADENCTATIYLKPAGYTSVVVRFSDAGSTRGFQASFDASTGLFGSIGAGFGGGMLILKTVEALASGWYRVRLGGNIGGGVTAATLFVYLYPNIATANSQSAFTGDGTSGVHVWGAQVERGVTFPSSYIKTVASTVTRAADAFTQPYNFGPTVDLTVLVRLARPTHADASGALGLSPGIFSFGAGAAPRIGAYFDPAARNIVGVIDTATTDATQSAAIPAGHPTICFQFKNLTTGGQVALDVGSGMSAFSSAATAFSAFSSPTLRIGRYDDELYGVIGDLLVARGLFTRTEMMAVL